MASLSFLSWDGERLSAGPDGPGRKLAIDPRCLAGDPVAGAWASVCALPTDSAVIPYDQPEVQGARREAMQWWLPLLGDALICLSTFSVDPVNCGGAITVARGRELLADDPFAHLFPQTIVATDIFSEVAPPPGPVLERYAGVPWPGGSFG